MCCYNSMFTGMYPVGMNVPLKTNRENRYAHVPPCRERVWRTVCSVCAYGARVVHHFLSNFIVLEDFHRRRNLLSKITSCLRSDGQQTPRTQIQCRPCAKHVHGTEVRAHTCLHGFFSVEHSYQPGTRPVHYELKQQITVPGETSKNDKITN